jgi:hypothetical protein
MFTVIMQFIPGSDQIWVSRLSENDPIYSYSIEQEAIIKASELQTIDPTGRQYKVQSFSL